MRPFMVVETVALELQERPVTRSKDAPAAPVGTVGAGKGKTDTLLICKVRLLFPTHGTHVQVTFTLHHASQGTPGDSDGHQQTGTQG